MLIVSENLRGIARSLEICDAQLVEEYSVQVRLDRKIRRLKIPQQGAAPIIYEAPFDVQSVYEPVESITDSLILAPGQCVLACSQAPYKMPLGYFGLLQTKGSLARMFVSATANDGQVEPGYSGRITLELTNHGTFSVAIRPGAAIAQMFVFRCSSEVARGYDGRYQGATEPTVPRFD